MRFPCGRLHAFCIMWVYGYVIWPFAFFSQFACLPLLCLLAKGSSPAVCWLPRLQFFAHGVHPVSPFSWQVVCGASRLSIFSLWLRFCPRGNGHATWEFETSAAHLAFAHASCLFRLHVRVSRRSQSFTLAFWVEILCRPCSS